VAREDVPGDRRLVAYVAGDVAADALRASLQERLPDYMVPASFVTLPALPRTASGKVDRQALPAPERPGAASYLAPRTPVEEVLAGIWAELLGLARAGAGDRFFDLGGHSLLATRMISRVREAFGVEVPLRDLFETPVLADFAAKIDVARRTGTVPPAPPLIPIPPALRREPLPLSFAQRRLWFIDQLNPGSALYNIPVALRVAGPLDAGVLALCCEEIVRRHEALRTVFAAQEGAPVQVIQPAPPFVLPVVDLSGLLESRRETLALTLAGEEGGRPFDLARGPLLRGLLLRLATGDHVAALTLHHIVSDAWSMDVLVRELAALYAAFAAGRPSPLSELPLQYADFAVWQRSWLQGEVLEGEISFWRRQLAGLSSGLELPADRQRPAVQSFRGASRPIQLPAALTGQALALSRSAGATLFMVLLAGFQSLLSRYSGRQDIAVGSPVAGRNRIELEGLIGFFVNTLVLRGDLAGEPTFRELLGRARETALASYLHQDVPFEKLVEELSPERSLAHASLFQVMFVLQNAPLETLAIPNLRLQPLDVEAAAAKLDLTLTLEETDHGLAGSLVYATDLFDATTAQRMSSHFERLLAGAVSDPDRTITDLPLLAPTELHQLRVGWNPAAVQPREPLSTHERFEAQAERRPDAVALVYEGRLITYRDLNRRANQLAHYLKQRGVGPEAPIGLFLERTPELVVAILGIMKAGGAYVPLDTTYPKDRLAYLLQDSGARLLLTEEALQPLLPAPAPPLIRLGADWPEIRRETAASLDSGATPDHLAYVLYTSGSTGRSKGVGVTHASLMSYIDAIGADLDLPPDSSYVMISTIAADGGNTALFLSLCTGGRLHILSRDTSLDPRAVAEYFQRHPIDFFKIVVSHFATLFNSPYAAQLLPRQRLLLGGEALGWELVDAILRLAPECQVIDHYGPTETTVGVLMNWIDPGTCGRLRPPMVPPGRPLANAEMHVLDRYQQRVPIGVIGELYVGGACAARGYLNRPDLTAERFVPNPFGEGRLYRTGDLVRFLPDGRIEFLGRADNQVKIRGFRIELGEIEAALVALPGVREAVVTAREDTPGGDRRLVAYIAGQAPGLTAERLRYLLRDRLPDYMVPAAFVILPELPLIASGKVDRRALPAPQWQSTETGYVPPRTPVEEILAGIWAELLGLDRVGPADQFFELGGHSLLATQVMSRLRVAFDVEMPLRDLFEAPVLADLAARIEAARRTGAAPSAPPLIPIAPEMRREPLPLSFAQQRLWFIDQLEPGSALYNIPVALRVAGPLDCAGLARCLGEIVRRHEALRTVFAAPEGSPVQVIQPAAPCVLNVVDLSGLPEGEREALALDLAGEEASRPFELARGPLLRGMLLRLAEDDHVAALTMHHIASDGWSMGVLVREVVALYAAFAAGRPSPLPDLPVQYADFAVWQRSWLKGDVLESEISFWRRQLAGLPPRLELPIDRPRPATQSHRGAFRPVRLPAELTRRLETLGRREGATLFMVLLAGFQALLARYSGQNDLAVGTPVAGRNRAEIEGLIGFFVNTLVLRGDLTGEPSFRNLLGRVRETALAAHAHQDVPFEEIVQELSPERSLAHSPLFQVVLVLQNAPVESLEIENLRLRPVSGVETTTKCDLTLNLEELDGGLAGSVEHATDLFDATTIHRLLAGFERLLESAAADPDQAVAEIPLLSPRELHQARIEWSPATAAPGISLVEMFEGWVDQTPAAAAVLAPDETLTYTELDHRANQLARRLRALGVTIDSRVGLCAERSPEMIVGVLGILKAGAAYVPLDPAYPRERLALMIDDAGLSVLLTQERLLDSLPAAAAVILRLDADWSDVDRESGGRIPGGAAPESLAYVIYTSGSTGRPKGVMVDHRGWGNLAAAQRLLFGAGPGTRVLQFASLSFDASAWEIAMALGAGAALVLGPRERQLSAAELTALLRESTIATLPPTVLATLSPGDLPGLETLVVAGEACPLDLARQWSTGRRFFNAYGPTEATVCATAKLYDGGEALPIGRPIERVQAYVLDARAMPVPIGVAGELVLGGPGLARGYLDLPERTARSFVPHPFATLPGERLYRTGDLVRWTAAGELEFLGRFDHQVKVRGFRIELGEIEAALLALAGVREAVVVAREDTPANQRLVAYVVGDAAADALRQSLRERLPDYMVPSAFVLLPAFPLTASGKVDRKALLAPELQGSEDSFLAPRTPIEEVLAGIWGELLGSERIGAAGHFFELGGHSLLAVQVISRLHGTFGVELPLSDLFEAPKLADLAARIESALRAGAGRRAPP
ncbi:MAG TPA: amino acid adenylation domain-containing protein, partial [Thermoanaerobaculia bacterium]